MTHEFGGSRDLLGLGLLREGSLPKGVSGVEKEEGSLCRAHQGVVSGYVRLL